MADEKQKQIKKLKQGLEKLLKSFGTQKEIVQRILDDLETEDEKEKPEKKAETGYRTSCFCIETKNKELIDEF